MKAVCHFCRREFRSAQGVRAHLKSCPHYLEQKRGASEPETKPSRPGDPQDEGRSPQEQDVGSEAGGQRLGRRSPTTRRAIPPERLAWLKHYKELAVSQLPQLAPSDLRVCLRRKVEEALAEYGADDSTAEIDDIVNDLAHQARTQFPQEGAARARKEKKMENLQAAELLLDILLDSCPHDLVGRPNSLKRTQVSGTMRRELRALLTGEFTGEETTDTLLQRVHEWLADWLLKNDLPPALDVVDARRAWVVYGWP